MAWSTGRPIGGVGGAVSEGHLEPQGIALLATEGNRKYFEQQRSKIEAEHVKERDEALAIADSALRSGAALRAELAAIDRLRLGRLYRDAPPGDLFLVLHRHRRDAFPSTGCPHLAQTVVSVIGDGGRRRRLRLPGRGGRSPA